MNNKDDDVGNVPVYVTLSVDDGDDVVSNVSVTSFRPPEVNDRRPAYSNGSLDGSMEYSASVESHNDASPPPSPSDAPLPRRGAPTSSVDSVDSFPVNARAKYKASKQAFDFHICKLPLLRVIDRHVDLKELEGLEFVAEGSHSEVYAATWRGKTVIVKILSSRNAESTHAIHEFNVECELLCRMDHPHILGILGAGNVPRPFIIVDRVRDLSQILNLRSPDAPLSGMNIFRPSPFKFPQVLQHAKALADALTYCHTTLHDDAMIVHRDLKPENLGIGADGQLYLYDWGLCRCVLKRADVDQQYTMTGMAGSLRYMAPEVVLRQPYTEKVDVYSFALVVWAMAKNDAPYKYLDRKSHYDRVVLNHERPEMPTQWPKDFRDLLASCWHADPHLRPGFTDISDRLAKLLALVQSQGGTSAGEEGKRRFSSISTTSVSTTWSAGSTSDSAGSNKQSGRISRALRRSFNSLFSFANAATMSSGGAPQAQPSARAASAK